MVAKSDHLRSSIQKSCTLVVLGQRKVLFSMSRFTDIRTVLRLLGGLPFHVLLLVLAEDVGQRRKLSLTAVSKDANTRLFLNAEWSGIFESLVMSAALIVGASDRFHEHTVGVDFILPASRIAFLFLVLSVVISSTPLWHGNVDLIFFFIVLAT